MLSRGKARLALLARVSWPWAEPVGHSQGRGAALGKSERTLECSQEEGEEREGLRHVEKCGHQRQREKAGTQAPAWDLEVRSGQGLPCAPG